MAGVDTAHPAPVSRMAFIWKPVRDAAGQIDIQRTMQAVTSVIEG
jgi:hypothetical protein